MNKVATVEDIQELATFCGCTVGKCKEKCPMYDTPLCKSIVNISVKSIQSMMEKAYKVDKAEGDFCKCTDCPFKEE